MSHPLEVSVADIAVLCKVNDELQFGVMLCCVALQMTYILRYVPGEQFPH